ncbi:hypothetical protein DPSP01_006826 [Paraphaeosphaeria sporulosa]
MQDSQDYETASLSHCDASEDKQLLSEHADKPARQLSWYRATWTLRNVLLSHLLTCLFVYLPVVYFAFQREASSQACDRKLSTWSPALDEGAVSYLPPAPFAGDILQTNKWRGEVGVTPSAEIDKAWTDIGVGVPGFRVSAEEVRVLGKPFRKGTRTLHAMPDGKGGYVAQLEVNHLLHCLNNLRQAMAWNYDHYFAGIPVRDVQIHHDALRASLQCTSDTTPVLYYDDAAIPQRQFSFPDFSTKHTCRDFDKLMGWTWSTERMVLWEDVGNSTFHQPELSREAREKEAQGDGPHGHLGHGR